MEDQQCLILGRSPNYSAQLVQLCESLGCEVSFFENLNQDEADLYLSRSDIVFLFVQRDDVNALDLLGNNRLHDAMIIVMADEDIPQLADRAIQRGASYYLCSPLDLGFVRQILIDRPGSLMSVNTLTSATTPCVPDQFGYLRGSADCMRDIYRMMHKVALTETSVMVAGESGTGKELVARTVHGLSRRAASPFVAVNCAALTDTLIESELFGHEKGSFSGAHKRHLGYFEHAQGGTLLLDEITEMNLGLQAKLLRVLETRKLRRVGAEKDIELDVRIISTTNRIPEQAVKQGILREDLYFRLAQIPVTVPPLRARGNDICGLAQYFLNKQNSLHNTTTVLAPETLALFKQYHWPGNVRQLRNVVERAHVMSAQAIEPGDCPGLDAEIPARRPGKPSIAIPLDSSLADAERILIAALLENNDNNKKKTADDLGISLKTLYNRLQQYRDKSELRIVV